MYYSHACRTQQESFVKSVAQQKNYSHNKTDIADIHSQER